VNKRVGVKGKLRAMRLTMITSVVMGRREKESGGQMKRSKREDKLDR
jgi:hypothetical protein